MKVIGKDIGTALDEMYAGLEQRVRVEAERALRVEPFEGGSFSAIEWEPDAVVIVLHNGVPTRALPHVFGVALQHVRQRLDRYPSVVEPNTAQPPGADMVRAVLGELVLAPEAELHLQGLGLDLEWETEQRHAGLKEMMHNAEPDWNEPGTLGHAFASLQYAQFSLTHPAELWESLQAQMRERLPAAAESGERVLGAVRAHGWASPGGCLESLVAARDELELQPIALIQDARSGELY